MANRRMFSKTITSSSQFLMMPQSSQNLYFHLGMNSDDDGFCEHFTVMRMTDSKPDDLKVLAAKGYVKVFDDKVLVILDWKENNFIRSDRYTPSKYLEEYKEEMALLSKDLSQETLGIPDDNHPSTEVRLGKVRLVDIYKDFDKKITINGVNQVILEGEKQRFLDYWSEKSDGSETERWQMEKVWDIKKRWQLWLEKAEEKRRRNTKHS